MAQKKVENLDRQAARRFTMIPNEMPKGKTNAKGEQVSRDLHKRMKAAQNSKK